MFSFSRPRNPCAKPSGINIDLLFLSLRYVEKYLPNVLDFFLQSITTSNILPLITDKYLPCEFFS